MTYLSEYCDILGRPGEGVHKHVGGVAIVDLVGTILVAFALSDGSAPSFGLIILGLMVLALLFHLLFAVPTTLTRAVFPNANYCEIKTEKR